MTENLRNGSIAKHIQELVNDLKEKSMRIEQLEHEVSLLKASKKELEEVTIPSVMMEQGVQELRLMSGDEIEVKPFYYARLPKDNPESFFSWLRQNGFGALIKEQVSIQPTPEQMLVVLEFLKELQIHYESGSTIHWKTLEAWFKECVEGGILDKLPTNLFPNYVGNKAKIRSGK